MCILCKDTLFEVGSFRLYFIPILKIVHRFITYSMLNVLHPTGLSGLIITIYHNRFSST